MKKILLIAMVLLSTSAFAQKWTTTQVDADPLKKQVACTTYAYSDAGCTFTFWSVRSDMFCLTTTGDFFNCYRSGNFYGVLVHIGLYDENDQMLEMFDLFLEAKHENLYRVDTPDRGVMSNPVGQGKKVRKIFEHLRSGKGYVRFVADRYQGTDFDLRVLPIE